MIEMSDSSFSTLTILYVNIRGQTKFYLDKQLQLQEMIKRFNCDIVHLQESHIEDDTFSKCDYIRNNYSVISNNSTTGYGTSSIVKNEIQVENISFDTEGRVIVLCEKCNSLQYIHGSWNRECLAVRERKIL